MATRTPWKPWRIPKLVSLGLSVPASIPLALSPPPNLPPMFLLYPIVSPGFSWSQNVCEWMNSCTAVFKGRSFCRCLCRWSAFTVWCQLLLWWPQNYGEATPGYSRQRGAGPRPAIHCMWNPDEFRSPLCPVSPLWSGRHDGCTSHGC